MPSPLKPTEFCALVPSGTSSLCDRLLAVFLKMPKTLCDFFTWMLNPDGTLSDAFKQDAQIIPAGMVLWRASTVTPTGWFQCNGQPVSRAENPVLFSVIGTTFGAGDGVTTFNVPNIEGKFIVGKKSTQNVGDTGGEETHILTSLEARPGTLTVTSANMNKCDGGNSTENLHALPLNGVQIGGHVHDGADITNTDIPLGTGTANNAHNNLPPFIALVAYIKT